METHKTIPTSGRASLATVAADYHGALDYAELARWGYSADDVVDFSVNSNPYGPHPAVREAIAEAALARYPDKACLALRAALAAHLDVDREQLFVANGTAELIWLIAFCFVEIGDKVTVVGPTFGEYARMCKLMGAVVEGCSADDIALRLADKPRLLFLCTPNNPTGAIFPPSQIRRWAEQAPETIFVIDEAYLNFVEGESTTALGLPNIITMRSMTKDYALAGVRLGYAVAHRQVVKTLEAARVPWSVNELAQAAGIAALDTQEAYRAQWTRLRAAAAQLKADLAALGYAPEPSPMHYFLVNVDDGNAFRERLLRHGVIVRKCESFGLPQMVSLSCQTDEQNQRLLKAIQK